MSARTLRFETCACRRHGRFHDGEGKCGPEVADQRSAKAFLERAVAGGKTPMDVAARLYAQVERSGLPKTPSRADRALLEAVASWEAMVHATNRPDLLWQEGREGCLVEKFFKPSP